MQFHPKRSFVRTPHKVGKNGVTTVYDFAYDGLELSESHFRKKDGSWSGGGPFYVYRKSRKGTYYPLRYTQFSVWDGVVGSPNLSSIVPVSPAVPDYYSAANLASLNASYATGYARARPGNPVAHAGQFLFELHQFPTVPFGLINTVRGFRHPAELALSLFHKLKTFRSLGNEYLNIVFGWKPFVQDVRQMYNLYRHIDSQLAEIVRNNGRGIRRRATIEDSSSVAQTSSSFPWWFASCAGLPPSITGKSLVTTTTRTLRRRWFAGKFQYYIPDIGSSEWTKKATRALFGLNPTPSLLWELLPWSWLIDWFSNVGDVISNASSNAVDNLTTQYSYVMDHQRTEVTYSCYTEWPTQYSPPGLIIPGGRANLSTVELTEKKMRAGGLNPFGLGIQFSSLSNYQIGILAALGLSRGLVK